MIIKEGSEDSEENKYLKWNKGQNLSIKTIAMIILGIMIVVLVYGAFSGWFETVVNKFTGNMTYPDPQS